MAEQELLRQYEVVARLRERLLTWGRVHVAYYPWRGDRDPYRVLVSELMLHRTRAGQVVPVYEEFMAAYPSLEAFGTSELERFQSIVSPLGLHWRQRLMRLALLRLWHEYGNVPIDEAKLLAIDGIGHYIAGATVCFCTDRPVALVDANTVRVTGRVFDLDLSGEARRRRAIREAIEGFCDPASPRQFYYCLIDLAHQVCHRSKPDCGECPFGSLCLYHLNTDPVPEC